MTDGRVHGHLTSMLNCLINCLIASEPSPNCLKWHVLVSTSSNGTFTIDVDSGVVEPFAPNASRLHVRDIATDPSRGYAFFTYFDRKVIWRTDLNDGNEVTYELPSGDSYFGSVTFVRDQYQP